MVGFDRGRLVFRPLGERRSKVSIEEVAADPDATAPDPGEAARALDEIASAVRLARERGGAVILCHGAHLIRNGLGTVVIRLLREGWVTHVATNGAGSIHDWEFAFSGKSTEDVRENVAKGEFGMWEETGRVAGLSLLLGAVDGLGYGASIGRTIFTERLRVPSREELCRAAEVSLREGTTGELSRASACIDLLRVLEAAGVRSGELRLPHPWKAYSVQAAAYELGIPCTVHPGIGQDIIYAHPLVDGAALGRAAVTDFLAFASSVERLQGGVYVSVGSSVMSPMVFEKALSMARNVRRQAGLALDDFLIAVNDLATPTWDWSRGEPPKEDPAYYVRFCKSFSRMGGRFVYVGADNRVFLRNLYARLRSAGPAHGTVDGLGRM